MTEIEKKAQQMLFDSLTNNASHIESQFGSQSYSQPPLKELRKKVKDLNERVEFLDTKIDLVKDALNIQLNLLLKVDKKVNIALGIGIAALLIGLRNIVIFG